MRIDDLFSTENIVTQVKGNDKFEIIEKLIDLIGSVDDYGGKEEVLRVVKERERMMSTGVGHGIAIPHGKVDQGEKVKASLCTIDGGVDFGSPDQMPTFLAILLIGPKSETGTHIRALAHISKLLQDEQTRNLVIESKDPNQVLDIMKSREKKYFS